MGGRVDAMPETYRHLLFASMRIDASAHRRVERAEKQSE
jgi:hypothetical protein